MSKEQKGYKLIFFANMFQSTMLDWNIFAKKISSYPFCFLLILDSQNLKSTRILYRLHSVITELLQDLSNFEL